MPSLQSHVDGASAPFGYRFDPSQPHGLIVHGGEVAILQKTYEAVVDADPRAGDVADQVAADFTARRIAAPRSGWTGAIVRGLVNETRHIGIVVAPSTMGSDGSKAGWSVDVAPRLVCISTALFSAAHRAIRTSDGASVGVNAARMAFALLDGRPAPGGPGSARSSSNALVTAVPDMLEDWPANIDETEDPGLGAPCPVVDDGADTFAIDELGHALPALSTVVLAQRKPFERGRTKIEVLGTDVLPNSSRRKVAASSGTRTRRRSFFYARYSIDKSEEKSEARQFADIAGYAIKVPLDETGRFSDRGRSGKAMHNRPGLQAMMAKARLERPDAILVEDLDRLSRRLPDLLSLFYELKLLGIELHDITLGKLDLIHIVMRGYMAEEGRVRFLALTRAGKIQALRDGKLISKGAYGYRLDPQMKGVHLVDKPAKAVICWIFKMMAGGMSAGACARELTKRKVLPPSQRRDVLAGGKVAEFKPWQPKSVLQIVHNHVYLGYVTLNRQQRVVDAATGMTTGYDLSDEKGWIVVKHEELALVDEDVWTRANLRVSDQTYRSAASGQCFLLTRKLKCTCGGVLKARATENATYYECTTRMFGADCEVRDHHRLDWVETAVLEKILSTVLGPDGTAQYVATYEAEIEQVLASDVRRAKAIKRRLTEIDDLQLRSFSEAVTDGLKTERVAHIRRRLEKEAEDLLAELSDLRTPADFLTVLHAIKGIEGDLSRMLEEVPFRPADPEGILMSNAIRDAVAEVVVHPVDADGWTRLVIAIDYMARFRDQTDIGNLGRIVLETGFNAADMREADLAARNDRNGHAMAEAAEDGRFDLTEAEWTALRPLTRKIDLARDDGIDPRELLEGMVCFARAGGPFHRIPPRYGAQDPFRRAVTRFVYAGLWDDAKRTLTAMGCAWIKAPGFAHLDTMEFPRRTAGRRPEGTAAAVDRKLLEELAKKEPKGDPVRLRLELVAMILDGERISDAARAQGISMSSAYHHWDKYKAYGVDAVRRKKGPGKASYLTPDQVKILAKIAKTGVDPNDGEAFLTYPILCRICQVRFGVTYSRSGMILMARRHGFMLLRYVTDARRRRNLAIGLPVLPPAAPRRLSPMHGRRVGTPSSKKARRELQLAAHGS